jgi:YidC/Oxa1 family membrane protein insertase
MAKMFTAEMEERGCPAFPLADQRATPHDQPVDWVAAKNKYFVQILTPEGGGGGRPGAGPARARAARVWTEGVAPQDDGGGRGGGVGAEFAEQTLAARREVGAAPHLLRGAQEIQRAARHALHQVDVMEFGDWIKPISKLLLKVLNFIHSVIPNYGIAIILLTVIVKVVFWPVTHKSTESMKRMAQVAPLVNQLREKYKDNPQKQQQEIMALYKEHKVNPLGGCLPMLIQIPVFFALFTVLRSAIELRFADVPVDRRSERAGKSVPRHDSLRGQPEPAAPADVLHHVAADEAVAQRG